MASSQAISNPGQMVSAPLVSKTTFIAVVWAGLSIGTIALAARFFVRIKTFNRLRADDFIAGFAWVLLLATAILWQVIVDDLYEITEVSAGIRMPSVDFIAHAEKYLKGSLAVLFIFYVGLWTIKLNFLVFFYHLGDKITAHRIFWWVVTVFTIATGFVCIGTIQYHCLADPFTEIMQHCTQAPAIRFQDVTLKVNCALDVITDALICSIPIAILRNVRINRRRKLVLSGLFCLVVITMIVSIIRVSVVTARAHGKQVEMTFLYMWHFIESSVALLVACLASFRHLFTQQERIRESEEAKVRQHQDKESEGPSLRAQKAKRKFFQESLFDTLRSTDAKASRGTDETYLNSVDHAAQPGRKNSQTTSQVDSDASSFDEMPRLNTHGILEGTVHEVPKHN